MACQRQGCIARSRMPIKSPLKSVSLRTLNGAVAVSFATVAFLATGSTISFAQEKSPQEELHEETKQKVIHEPVHRVPKVADSTNSVLHDADNSSGDNVPKNIQRNSVPAVLPAAVKTVTEPAPTAAAPTVDPPATKKVPAIKASATKAVKPAPHPLDDALETARRGLDGIRANVRDYSAVLVKRERVDGKLGKHEYMKIKVRSEGVKEDGSRIPFSVYMKFIKPKECAGRELIWVKGKNENQMCVHEGSGIIALKTFNLDPDGWLAMKGQRYPVYEAGMENLVVKLIEKAERDKAAGNCEVVYRDGVKIQGRECSVIEVTHAEERAPYDFHIAKVYIDTELQLPIRYQAHIWPKEGSTKPRLLEEYTYLHVKLNQGFTDKDFDPANPAYNYPGH